MKLDVKQNHILKVLDYIAGYPNSHRDTVIIDDRFFQGLQPMKYDEIVHLLNAMEAENLIVKTPPTHKSSYPTLKLTVDAFSYRLRNRKTTIPIVISNAIAVAALIISILAYIKQ